MVRFAPSLIVAISMAVAAPVHAEVRGFAIVNATGAPLTNLSIRRVGSTEWKALPVDRGTGGRIISTFTDVDCAFDLRGSVPGDKEIEWRGLNLCDVKSVTLNRDRSGRTWVDYD